FSIFELRGVPPGAAAGRRSGGALAEGAGTRPSRAPAGAVPPRRTGSAPRPSGPPEKWVRCRAREGASVTDSPTRCYVLDTSVLLSDPWSLARFDGHEVVLPLVVISELEGKRHHPELGWFARTALRTLDDLRIEHGRLDAPVPVGNAGGTLHVELNHTDPEVLPAGFRTDSNDSRILACALNLAAERRADGRGPVVLVTQDIPLRVKAAAVGLTADEYHALDVVPTGWTGMADVAVTSSDVDTLFKDGVIDLDAARELPF